MILVATTTLGIPARSIYSRFFTSSASQVGLAIVMREIYIPLSLSHETIVSPSSFKISFQIPRSLARSNRSPFPILILPPPSPDKRLSNLTSRSQSRRLIVVSRGSGGGEKGKRFVRSNVLFGSSARCNNAERKTKNSRSPLHGGHLDPRTREEAVIALKWTWVAQGPPLSPWTRNNKFSTARR